jgi:hypothetical protein
MSDIFPRSNPALDAAVNDATSPEHIRELVKSSMESAGLISRERGAEYGAQLLRQPEPTQEAPRLDERRDNRPINAERVLYLSGNSRIVITSADGESALDLIEQQLRASLGCPR